MEQLKDEITRFRPNLKNKIQCIDDSSKNGDIEKDIVICVFNSIGSIDIPFSNFEKIYVDAKHFGKEKPRFEYYELMKEELNSA